MIVFKMTTFRTRTALRMKDSELPHEGPHPAEVHPAHRYPRRMRREPERFEPVFRH